MQIVLGYPTNDVFCIDGYPDTWLDGLLPYLEWVTVAVVHNILVGVLRGMHGTAIMSDS